MLMEPAVKQRRHEVIGEWMVGRIAVDADNATMLPFGLDRSLGDATTRGRHHDAVVVGVVGGGRDGRQLALRPGAIAEGVRSLVSRFLIRNLLPTFVANLANESSTRSLHLANNVLCDFHFDLF